MAYSGMREKCVNISSGHVYRADIVALPDARDDLQYLTHGCLQRHKNTMMASFCERETGLKRGR